MGNRRSKYLIIHADDLGLSEAVNRATVWALKRKYVTSSSLMVPAPGFKHAISLLKKQPKLDIGIHITLTSEWVHNKWKPLAGAKRVPSLVDRNGCFWSSFEEFEANAKVRDVETEMRAQLNKMIRSGIYPSHLDCHMSVIFRSPRMRGVVRKIAREFGVRFPSDLEVKTIRSAVASENWFRCYSDIVKSLKIGTTQLIVHLGRKSDGFFKVNTDGLECDGFWRSRDLAVISDLRFQKLLKQQNVLLTNWKGEPCGS